MTASISQLRALAADPFWATRLVDEWFPAHSGTETPTTYPGGLTFTYVYNPMQGVHGFHCHDDDVVYTSTDRRNAAL